MSTFKTLVTGGAGFIGSHVAEALLKNGHEVVVLDNFHTGSMDNIRSIPDRASAIQVIRGSVGDLASLRGFDYVCHLGMASSAPMYLANPMLVGTTINDAQRLFDLAARHDVRRVVFASTSSMYNGLPPPHQESMAVPVSDYYTEARFGVERLARLSYNTRGLQSIGLRMFSVYGLREEAKGEYANLVTQFLLAMQQGLQPELYGDGSQTRDFTHISDVVDAWLSALASEQITCDVCNVGTGTAYSLNELVALLNTVLETDIAPRYVGNPLRAYVLETQADTRLAEELLPFRAHVTLRQGIDLLRTTRKP